MNTLDYKKPVLSNEVKDVAFTRFTFNILLKDGREIRVPLVWFPRLNTATSEERENWRIIGNGVGIHFEDIDEDISVDALLS